METVEYEDEDVLPHVVTRLKIDQTLVDENDPRIKHITNTKNYSSDRLAIITPEEIAKINEKEENENPNPEFTKAIHDLQAMTKKELTKEEYVKAADVYATILAERDEEKRKNYEGKYEINPIKKDIYLSLILQNKPVTNAFAETMKNYENSKIDEISRLLAEAQKEPTQVIETKMKTRVNMRYKGKCRINSDEGGKVFVIDNKNDVNLLKMKYRKEWIDKRYANQVGTSEEKPDDGIYEYE